jgi:hypothetical protein
MIHPRAPIPFARTNDRTPALAVEIGDASPKRAPEEARAHLDRQPRDRDRAALKLSDWSRETEHDIEEPAHDEEDKRAADEHIAGQAPVKVRVH